MSGHNFDQTCRLRLCTRRAKARKWNQTKTGTNFRRTEEILDEIRQQTDEKLRTKVPVRKKSNINELINPKRKPPENPKEVEEQKSESVDKEED